jgi:hypothetical protein
VAPCVREYKFMKAAGPRRRDSSGMLGRCGDYHIRGLEFRILYATCSSTPFKMPRKGCVSRFDDRRIRVERRLLRADWEDASTRASRVAGSLADLIETTQSGIVST